MRRHYKELPPAGTQRELTLLFCVTAAALLRYWRRRRDVRPGLMQSRTQVSHTQHKKTKKNSLIILLELDGACGSASGSGSGGGGGCLDSWQRGPLTLR